MRRRLFDLTILAFLVGIASSAATPSAFGTVLADTASTDLTARAAQSIDVPSSQSIARVAPGALAGLITAHALSAGEASPGAKSTLHFLLCGA